VAIVLLGNGSSAVSGTGVDTATVAAALSAGTRRMLVVAVGGEVFSASFTPVVPSVTYGGVAMSRLVRADGADSRIQIIVPGFNDTLRIDFFALRESELLTAVDTNIVATWLASGSTRVFMVAYWLLGNVDQGPIVRDFQMATATSGTALGGTTGVGAASDAILVAGINNTNAGTIQITIDGVGLAENFDTSLLANARFAGANDLIAGAVTGIPFDMTYTDPASFDATAIIGVRIAEGFAPGGDVFLTDGPSGSATLDAA
jgi:hypothetical protein